MEFTAECNEMLKRADIEAARRNKKECDVHHILIAALEINSEIYALINQVSSVYAIKDELEKEFPDFGNDVIENVGKFAQTIDVERVSSLAQLEWRTFKGKSSEFSSGFFLLGILKDSKSTKTKEILKKHGVIYEKIRDIFIDKSKNNYETDPEKGAPATKKTTGNTKTKSKKEKTVLDVFGKNLNELVALNKIEPVIGRKKEILRVAEILGRKKKNNPVLIGDPGVGKTTIAEGLAYDIYHKSSNPVLWDKVVYTLDLTRLVAGSKYRGQFEEKIQAVLEEVTDNPNIILFIDEFHTLVGAGNAEGAMDAANIFKPALARGEIQCIGATTLKEFKIIEKDGALARRFQSILVDEPTKDETKEILYKLKPSYEIYHGVEYTKEAIDACVDLADRYLNERFFPDKAIDLLDESASKVKIRDKKPDPILVKMIEELAEITDKKNQAVKDEEFELAEKMKIQEKNLEEGIDAYKKDITLKLENKVLTVDETDIQETISTMTGIPASRIGEDQFQKLSALPTRLMQEVIGQKEAIDTITKSLKKNSLGLKDPNRPVGTFVLLGPSGSGKTMLAKKLAKELFDDEEACLRFDMSEYMEKFNVSKLIGAPPGYVGYEEGGLLTEAVRRKPYSIILFDEIEKADPEVFNILLQILGEGRLTDSEGRLINFKNTVIILTSNLGTSFDSKEQMGFSQEVVDKVKKMKAGILTEFQKTVRKELLNRLDGIIVFNPLSEEALFEIIDQYIIEFKERLKPYKIDFEMSNEIKSFIVKEGYNISFGARELKRKVEEYIEDSIVDKIIEGKIKNGETVKFVIKSNKIEIE